MGSIANAIVNLVESIIDAILDVVRLVWDSIVEPILEVIFAILGITSETVVSVQKISTLVYGNNIEDTIRAAKIRAIFSKIKTDTSFFPNYMTELFKVKAQIRAYFRYAELGLYIHGLPDMRISGSIADFTAIGAALDTDLGTTNTVLTITTQFPTPELFFKNDLQTTHTYLPYANTLTLTGIHGGIYTDWILGTVVFNVGTSDYTINVSRTAQETKFWIEGSGQITEGDIAVYTIKANRTVPVGESVIINFTYTGTAVNTTDYTQVASVIMLASTNSINVNIPTLETANANRNYTITIGSITNTNAAFEAVTIHTPNQITTVITDDDSLVLTMNDVITPESGNAIVIVKLEQAATGAFTVDYTFTDLTTTGGTDYNNTTGTLNFAGTAGETQNIVIPITADIVDDDKEQFQVGLTNSSDATIDITHVATVTIIDGTSDPAQVNTTVLDTITKPNFIPDRSLIVRYHNTADPASEWFYWFYKFSLGTFPNLEPDMNVMTGLEMLPIAILRKNKVSINSNTTSQEYITTKLLLKRLAINLDDFITSLEASPDIASIDDAFVNFSMGPNTTNNIISKLLYTSFFEIIVTNGMTSNINEFTATLSEGDVNNAVVWTAHSFTADIVGTPTLLSQYIHTIVGSDLKLQFQKTATTYNEIVISNLSGMSAINYQTHHQVALNKLGDDDFTIPLSWFVFNQLKAEEQLEVYQFLLRFDVFAIQITELAWYETSAFADLFSFALSVLFVISLGTSLIVNGLFAVFEQLVIGFAIGELIVWVAQLTGNEVFAAVVGIVAAIALADTSDFSFSSFPTGEELINLSTEFVNNLALSTSVIAQEAAADIAAINAQAAENLGLNDELKKSNPIDAEFLAFIRSVDTERFPAINAQYSFDQLYNYDNLIQDYYKTQLQIGVV